MAIFWTQALSVSVVRIDRQHQILLGKTHSDN